MHIEVNRSQLLAALADANSIADRRSMPILGNVLLSASADSVDVIATDMTIASTVPIPCEVHSAGRACVSAKHLFDIVKTLQGDSVALTWQDNCKLEIKSGRAVFVLHGLTAADFPDLPAVDIGGEQVPSADLLDLIGKTLFSVSTDETRVNLNGALLEIGRGTATMVSTDGHRLTMFRRPTSTTVTRSAVVPRRGLAELRKFLQRHGGDCRLSVTDTHAFVTSEGATLSIKLSVVTFPPWQQVLPKQHSSRAVIDRSELLAALRQAAVMAPEKTSTVRLNFDASELQITADNPELGSINLTVPIDYTGGSLVAGYNAEYLMDAIGVMESERVQFDLGDSLSPAKIVPYDQPDGHDLVAVVMPMRI